MMKRIIFTVLFIGFCTFTSQSQTLLGGKVSGNVQLDAQFPQKDSATGAESAVEKLRSNTFANVLYENGDFKAGVRFESYLNPIYGFDEKYKGFGFPHKFISYTKDKYEITVGSFYEQIGNGIIFRSYQDPNLGLDNAMNGINVKANPYKGINLKAFVGKQRYYWDYGPGLVRGIDGDFSLNDFIKPFEESTTRINLGAGFVSKYEESEQITTVIDNQKYELNLPLNVGAWSTRLNVTHGKFAFQGEYGFKGQDPNNAGSNKYIYRKGQALFLSGSYSQKGLGINIQAKRIDNMAFKSKRSETGEMLNINYLPSLNRQHSYAFMAMYPYATQAQGEMAIQGDIVYTIKKNTWLGGTYGMDVKLNYSRTHSIDINPINENTPLLQVGTEGYTSDFFKIGDQLYYEDFNIELGRKINKELRVNLGYAYITFNPFVEGHTGALHYNHVVVADASYKIDPKNVIRIEAEWLKSNLEPDEGDKRSGDWIMLSGEYFYGKHLFISVSDQYNYRGSKEHYYNASMGINYGSSRFQIGYGRQRDGIICIGGVCRQVPASTGFVISLTSSF